MDLSGGMLAEAYLPAFGKLSDNGLSVSRSYPRPVPLQRPFNAVLGITWIQMYHCVRGCSRDRSRDLIHRLHDKVPTVWVDFLD